MKKKKISHKKKTHKLLERVKHAGKYFSAFLLFFLSASFAVATFFLGGKEIIASSEWQKWMPRNSTSFVHVDINRYTSSQFAPLREILKNSFSLIQFFPKNIDENISAITFIQGNEESFFIEGLSKKESLTWLQNFATPQETITFESHEEKELITLISLTPISCFYQSSILFCSQSIEELASFESVFPELTIKKYYENNPKQSSIFWNVQSPLNSENNIKSYGSFVFKNTSVKLFANIESPFLQASETPSSLNEDLGSFFSQSDTPLFIAANTLDISAIQKDLFLNTILEQYLNTLFNQKTESTKLLSFLKNGFSFALDDTMSIQMILNGSYKTAIDALKISFNTEEKDGKTFISFNNNEVIFTKKEDSIHCKILLQNAQQCIFIAPQKLIKMIPSTLATSLSYPWLQNIESILIESNQTPQSLRIHAQLDF